MDIVGVPEVTAEAELLAAIVMLLERVGLTAEDVTIKVSSRKVLQAILEQFSVPEESFGAVCVVVDKLDKMSKEKVGILPQSVCKHILLQFSLISGQLPFPKFLYYRSTSVFCILVVLKIRDIAWRLVDTAPPLRHILLNTKLAKQMLLVLLPSITGVPLSF